MHRRNFLALAGIGSVAALAGCTTITAQDPPNIDQVNIEQIDRRTISVSGVGSVETEPDMVRFTVGVEASDRDDASAVVAELADRAEDLRDALLDYGIPEDDIVTDRYRLRENSRRGVYEGEHRYAVELDDPDAIGEVIDLAVDAGADSLGRINFTISEERREDLYDEAVEQAVEAARDEAELYASAAGESLGDPVSIETSRVGHRPFGLRVDLAVAEAMDASAGTQIDAGDVAVTAEVSIEYGLED